MVRDLFEGEAMARIMSLVFMVFMLVPVLAPNIGQAILLVAPWRVIFWVLAGYGAIMWAWSLHACPKRFTRNFGGHFVLAELRRRRPRPLRDRAVDGYTLALAASSALTAYIASIQQIDWLRFFHEAQFTWGWSSRDRGADGAGVLGQFAGCRPFRPEASRPSSRSGFRHRALAPTLCRLEVIETPCGCSC